MTQNGAGRYWEGGRDEKYILQDVIRVISLFLPSLSLLLSPTPPLPPSSSSCLLSPSGPLFLASPLPLSNDEIKTQDQQRGKLSHSSGDHEQENRSRLSSKTLFITISLSKKWCKGFYWALCLFQSLEQEHFYVVPCLNLVLEDPK